MPFDTSGAAGRSQTMLSSSYTSLPQAHCPPGQTISQAGPSRSAPISISSSRVGGSSSSGNSAKRHRPPGNGAPNAYYGLRDGSTSNRDIYDDEAEEEAEEEDVAVRLAAPLHGAVRSNKAAVPPPRKRMHFDFGSEDVGRFASMSIQQKQQRQQYHHQQEQQSSLQSSAYTVQSPSTSPTLHTQHLQRDSARDFLAIPNADVVEIPPPTPPCSPERAPAPIRTGFREGSRRSDHQQDTLSSLPSSSMGRPFANAGTGSILHPSQVDEPEEVEMRERKGPSQWEYAKDKIWVQSLDDSSTDEERNARRKEEEEEEGDGDSVAATASSSRRVSEEGSSFGTGKMDDANFILNPELIQKLEEEAKKRMFAQQTEQQEQRRAKSFFRKPKLFRVLTGGGGGGGSGRSNNSSTCSTGGRNSPSGEDGEHTKNALVLWRSPEEVLQSSKAHANNLGNVNASGKSGPLLADPTSKPPPRNLLDFGATAIPLQIGDEKKNGNAVRTETMDVVDSTWPSNDADAMELD